jgi:hypothetical protein
MNGIQYQLTAKRASIAAAMFASGSRDLQTLMRCLFPHAHKAKKGHLTITAPTEVGGTALGEYEVREAKSPSGPVIEFVHQFRNELASKLASTNAGQQE